MKPDLDKLLSSKDANGAIIELDDYICGLCSWGKELDKLTGPQKNFYFNQNLEREINNGGFNQYFFNSAGSHAAETVVSLKTIGANITAEIVQSAIDQFPSQIAPANRTVRQEILEQISEQANPVWSGLDERFLAYTENLSALNLEYVRNNKNAF